MYKATIVDKAIVNGVLRVKVKYEDGEDAFNDTIETSQKQPASWPADQIALRLTHLNEMPAMLEAIELEKEYTAADAPAEDAAQSAKDFYKEELHRFERFISAVAKGLTTEEHEDFITLKKWLADNFKADYLDLF